MTDEFLDKLELDTKVKPAFVEWLDSAVEYDIIKGYAVYDLGLDRESHFIRNVEESERYIEEDLKRVTLHAGSTARLCHGWVSYFTNDLRVVALVVLYDATAKVTIVYDEEADEFVYALSLSMGAQLPPFSKTVQKEEVESINDILYLFRTLHFATQYINAGSWMYKFEGNKVVMTPHPEQELIDVLEEGSEAIQLVSSIQLVAFNGKWHCDVDLYDTHHQDYTPMTITYPHIPRLENLITEVIVNL